MYCEHSRHLKKNIYCLGNFKHYTRLFYCDNTFEDIPLSTASYEELRDKYKKEKLAYSKDIWNNLKKINKFVDMAQKNGMIISSIIVLILSCVFLGMDITIQTLMAIPSIIAEFYFIYVIKFQKKIIDDKKKTRLQIELEDLVVAIADIDKSPEAQKDKEIFFSRHAFDGSNDSIYTVEYYRKLRNLYASIYEKLLNSEESPQIKESNIIPFPNNTNITPYFKNEGKGYARILKFPGLYDRNKKTLS